MANRRFIDFPIATIVGDSDIILIWQSGVNKQTTKATFLSGLPENLDELNDVTISGLTNGQILRYDSVTGKWVNTDQGNLDLNDLNDVSIVSPSNGQVLVYNSSTSKWENSSGGFVPYVGAVTTVDLGAQGLRAGYVRFDTSVASVPNEQGLMYWDASRSTAALIMNGTLQHIGQDSFFYVKNSSGSTIPKGTCVRFAGTDGASGHLLITPFLANGSVPSTYFMGVTAEAITNGSFGQVMHFGELEGINTSGFTAGALLYASTTVAGGFQTTVPVAPNNIVLVAAAVNSKNNGAIVVRPTYGSNINIDEGVKITSPTTGDLLQLQAGGLWENKTLAQVIGSAYVPSTRTLTINGTAFDLSANRSWIVGDVRTDGSYSNPSWITALAWSKITGTPTTLSGYGITDAVPNSRTITINGVTQDLSANRTFNVGTVTSVGLSSATSGVTIGGSPVTGVGAFTLTIATASGSQNGLLSSTDWTTFNNKQNALTNPVTGTGTTNYLPKFTGSTTIGNSNLINDASGNLGLGVTPSAWGLGKAIEFGNIGNAVWGVNTTQFNIIQNAYFDSGYKYASSNPASYYQQVSGSHVWYNAPSGTAGNVISFNPAMTLTSGGNLLVGTTTDNGARLQVSGAGGVNIKSGNGDQLLLNNAGERFTQINFNNNSSSKANIWWDNTNTELVLLANSVGTGHLRIASTGAATFSSSVTAGGTLTANTGTGATFRAIFGGTNVVEVGNYNATDGYRELLLSGSPISFYTSNAGASSVTERMRITSSGNVGIGTSSPSVALEVSGASNLASRIRAVKTGSGTIEIGADRDTFGSPYISAITNSNLDFFTNDTHRLRITSSGNVLIGTTTDGGYKLDVNGTTRSSIAYKFGTYTQGTTTPSVSNVSIMIISNSSPTTITNFTNAVAGQVLTLGFSDSNTTINRANAYLLNGNNYTSGPNDFLQLVFDGTYWFEISRSSNA